MARAPLSAAVSVADLVGTQSPLVASPDVVYDDHHINLVLMFYTAVSSSGRASSPAPAMTRMRARISDSADM